jgi:type VI secretion system secreted protein Hcp
MALVSFLKLKSKRLGEIKGGVSQAGRQNQIAVIGVSHDIVSPRDPASGQASGKRMHKPLVITKELDKATPLLFQVLTNGDVLTEFELHFIGTKPNGTEAHIYTMKLTNAMIASIHFEKANMRIPANAALKDFEVIAFTYESIEWTFVDGGITAQDDWEAIT